MVVNKRKKNSRQRAHTTHGWGAMKKHRGAGNRGGRGNAGSGKRGDAKKPSYQGVRVFGKHGFKKKGIKIQINAINITDINRKLDRWLGMQIAVKESNSYMIDLKKAGYNKLLGKGMPAHGFVIKVDYASKNAINRIKEMKGNVILPAKQENVAVEQDSAEPA